MPEKREESVAKRNCLKLVKKNGAGDKKRTNRAPLYCKVVHNLRWN